MLKRNDLSQLRSGFNTRVGEERWGQGCAFFGTDWASEIRTWPGQFLILYIGEDLGPQANGGRGGSKAGGSEVFSALANLQNNPMNPCSDVGFLGIWDWEGDLPRSIEDQREAVETLDQVVRGLLAPIFETGKTLILIGGGHNNSYPLIRSLSESLDQKVGVFNIDPHSDFRALEGRHSGNGFSYAFEEGYLERYAIMGLHENYNSAYLWDRLQQNSEQIDFVTYEDWLDNPENQLEYLQQLLTFLGGQSERKAGLELDLDSIAHFPTSAITPSGFSLDEARKMVRKISKERKFSYLHLPEGHLKENALWAKGLAYIITDFIKNQR